MIKKSFPDYWTFYNSLPSEWYRMELVRYFAVAKYGGFYIDLDMFCKKSLNPLCKNEYVVHSHKGRHWKGGGKCNFSENNFFAFKPRYLMSILKYSQKQFQEKSKIDVYKTWKVRLMLQTVGVKMYARWCSINKFNLLSYIVCTDEVIKKNKEDNNKYLDNCYFNDKVSKAWLKSNVL